MKNLYRKIMHFFDKFEDHVRGFLSHYPLWYAIIGSFGIVHLWRGIWHLADDWGWSSYSSTIIGLLVLLGTGLLVSFFIGDNILITGLKGERKRVEKTEGEIRAEEAEISGRFNEMKKHIDHIEKRLADLKLCVSETDNIHTSVATKEKNANNKDNNVVV